MQILNSSGGYAKDKCAKPKIGKRNNKRAGDVKLLVQDGVKLDVPKVIKPVKHITSWNGIEASWKYCQCVDCINYRQERDKYITPNADGTVNINDVLRFMFR